MLDTTRDTMPRDRKGPIAPPPALDGDLRTVADAVAGWPDVTATVHWALDDVTRVDGADFYVGSAELGHIHLDGWLHLATSPLLGAAIVAEGRAKPFPYARGWVHERIRTIGPEAAIALFRRNYDRLTAPEADAAPPA